MEGKIRPFTENQLRKHCHDAYIDMVNDGLDVDACAPDVAVNIICGDPRVKAYLIKHGINKTYWNETIADLIC
jgi:hypothetical protein